MRIGIGVTTYNRPECLAKWKEQIKKHTYYYKADVRVYIAEDTDTDRKGVAARKNECLRALKDCDYIFLFDDDTYPIKDGWIERFINSGHEHLLYLSDRLHNFALKSFEKEVYTSCGGVFMYMRKSAIDRVGAFNEKFTPYGFEHAEYSNRIYGKANYYVMMHDTSEYIYAEDYGNPDHKSSITDEEKNIHVKNNWDKYFKEPIKDIYIPL